MTNIIIRQPHKDEYESWLALYQIYLEHYQTCLTESELQEVWSWLFDKQPKMHCFVAEIDNQIVGLTHFRKFIRPIKAHNAIFLDDLIVRQEFRGKKIGYNLIQAVQMYAKNNNYPLVRWITTSDNQKAIKLYDSIATKTDWLTYDLEVD